MGVTFPYPPRPPSGDWTVTIPPDAGLGELLVYAKASEVASDFLRWKCDETALPLLEVNGYDHQLDDGAVGTIVFGQESFRSDDTGASVSISGIVAKDQMQLWTPIQDTPTVGLGFACLMDRIGSGSATPYCEFGLHQIARFGVYEPDVGTQEHDFYMWNGTAWVLIDNAATATFWAFRIDVDGNWKWWADSTTATGNYASFVPEDWQVFFRQNDGDYGTQEIHVWTTEPTDEQIETVRLSLVGY